MYVPPYLEDTLKCGTDRAEIEFLRCQLVNPSRFDLKQKFRNQIFEEPEEKEEGYGYFTARM